MKNAIYFFVFQIFTLLIYGISLSSQNNKKEISISKTFAVSDFNYSIITDHGDEVYLKGLDLTKDKTVKVILPKGHINFYNKKDTVFFSGKELELVNKNKFILKGDAELRTDNTRLSSEMLEFDTDKKILSSTVNTEVKSPFAVFKGDSFIFDIDEKKLRLNKSEGRLWGKH